MQPAIKIIPEKKLVGLNLEMSLNANRTGELWRSFMPRRKEIQGNLNNELISMQVYDEPVRSGDLNQKFRKWATVEVKDFSCIPTGMETFLLTGGLYAVFHYKGSSTDTKIFEYIFSEWLPSSNYEMDNRPHFEILGEKYKNADPESEEEICIPVKAVKP